MLEGGGTRRSVPHPPHGYTSALLFFGNFERKHLFCLLLFSVGET